MFISVVIPTHNRRHVVAAAVDSALAQQGSVGTEVIVVDDGSDDGTAEALASQFGTQIRLFQTANRGVSAARNLGVRQAAGDWIAFLDSDDLWLPKKLAAQTAFLAAHPETEVCQTQEIWIRNGVRVNAADPHRKPDGDVFAASLQRCVVSPSAVLLRRALFERLGGFDESLPACEDYDLWLRIGHDTPIRLVDAPLVVKHGGHADQLSRRFWGMDRFRVASLVRLLAEDRLAPQRRAPVAAEIIRKCQILAAGAGKRALSEDADSYLRIAAWAKGEMNGATCAGVSEMRNGFGGQEMGGRGSCRAGQRNTSVFLQP